MARFRDQERRRDELVAAALHVIRESGAANLKIRDVAERAGVSTQHLSEVERGRKEPSSEVIEAVGGALGLTLVDLTARVTRHLLATRSGTPRGPVALAA